MSAVAVLVADGFETIECLTIVDVLRRGGVRVDLISIMTTRDAVSSQQIDITCDYTMAEVDFDDYDYLVLPGGMPGTLHLRQDERVCDLVCEFAATRHVAAICAAPSILGDLGLLVGRQATCFPDFESHLPAGTLTGRRTVVVDGNIITASGMGQALPFALAVLGDIAGEQAVAKVRDSIQL